MILSEFKYRIFTSSILLFLIFLLIQNQFILMYSVLVFGFLSLIEFFDLIQKITKNLLFKFISKTLFIIFVSTFCILFSYFSFFFQLKILLFIFLFGCIGSDIGGYIFGKIFKGPKLTSISPKKTISGSIGSFILTFLVIGILMFYFTGKLNFKIFVLSFFISFACQLGDLFFSFLKRNAKVKDTGNFLPGHGGVLDRLDGIFFGIPVGFLTLLILRI